MTRRREGFTLIEVLAVLAILAILAALAYPSYAGQTVRARRVEAQLALMEAMQLQEQHRTLHHTYLAFSSDSGDGQTEGFVWWSGASPATSAYEIDAAACPGQDIARCVVLRATPGTDNVDARFDDPDCGTLTLDSTGRQTASGAAGRCWP